MRTAPISAMVPQYWAQETWAEALSRTFFDRFTGTGSGNIIQVKEELQKMRGDRIHFYLRMALEDEGVTGDSDHEGQEGSLDFYADSVLIDKKWFGVLLDGEMAEQKSAVDLMSEASEALAERMAKFVDETIFAQLSGNTSKVFANTPTAPTTGRILYGGDATGAADMASGDWFGVQEIRRLKYAALSAKPLIRPVSTDVGDYFVIVIHPRQAYTLRGDTAFQNAQYYAAARGSNNPIFTGALGTYEGCVIHEHDGIYQYLYSTTDIARALLLGAQAGLMALGNGPSWRNYREDADERPGRSIRRTFGVKKAVFNSVDYGVIAMDTYAEAPLGAAH